MIQIKRLLSITFLSLLLVPIGSQAQGTLADYKRAAEFKENIKDKVYHSPTQIQWHKKDILTYAVQTANGKLYMKYRVKDAAKESLFDTDQLAKALSEKLDKEVDPKTLYISALDLKEDVLTFRHEQIIWEMEGNTGALKKVKEVDNSSQYWGTRDNESVKRVILSPDKKQEAFIQDQNVFLKDVATGKQQQLTHDGRPGEYYSSSIQWSPDSKKLALFKFRPSEVRKLTLIASAPDDQFQPKVFERDYLKPGDALPIRTPMIIDIARDKVFQADLKQMYAQYALSRLSWNEESSAVTWEYNERGHQRYSVFEMNALDGKQRALIDETSETFIDYSGKYYRKDLKSKKQIIWSSERDGWRHLYLYDMRDGELLRQLTKGEWVVRDVIHVDEEKELIYFTASGKNQGEDPYHLHFYSIGLDGKNLKVLTSENANHEITFKEGSEYFVDKYARQDLPPVTVVRSVENGKVVASLEKADIRELEKAGWEAPEIFSAKGRDGQTDIWGVIIKPLDFDQNKKYPVIEYIYAGPHSAHVPKSFNPNYYALNELASLGFIVVQIDGMGTSNRSKKFHDVAWKNLKDAGFPDRILWMQAAAAESPYMDLEKVGIFGTSAGGQNSTGALLFHPEFYKVGVSSCGCHDNRMDKIWWNEQWMGYPIGDHYEDCSNVTHAKNLQGKLLLLVGEIDDNVDPASTHQLVDELVKHNKPFEFMMFPGMGHSSGGLYGERLRRDFFVKHLLNVTPPNWDEYEFK
ncbi:S9 family peptidase [Belliella sp. DSM 111904]|uniref:S9 family peptidase n=1 Tax=Belliella filtrata TaxID=2923435 RepID=A0ABS9V441_9BACT|nr:S9 family peptidase [Belliella filtrata]MCH7411176.1 S9 family peptidase [Belliella filtrata]